MPAESLPTRRSPGFSLVELIVVIAIILLLMAVGIGLLSNSRAEALRTSSEEFASLVEQARSSAITRRKPVALVVAEPGQEVSADGRCRIGLFELEEWLPGEVNAGRLLQRWHRLPDGVALFGGQVESLVNVKDQQAISLTWRDGTRSGEMTGLVFGPRGGLLAPAGSESVVVTFAEGGYQDGRATATGKERAKTIRVGRVVARPWAID